MATPIEAGVLAFLGRDADAATTEQITAHLGIVKHMVELYVRGVGFLSGIPDDLLAAVIVSSAARLVSNPTMTTYSAIDDAQVRQGTFQGWTLPELAILHSFRARAR